MCGFIRRGQKSIGSRAKPFEDTGREAHEGKGGRQWGAGLRWKES